MYALTTGLDQLIMALSLISFTTSIDRYREVQPFKVKSLILCI